MLLLNCKYGVLSIESRVHSQGARDNEERLCESLDSKLGLARDFLAGVLSEVLMSCNFESSSAWNQRLVLDGILYSTETITDGILGLGNTVVVWSLDEDSAREWVLNTLNEGVLVLSKRLLVDELGKSEIRFFDVVHRIQTFAATSEWDSFSVSALCSSNADDVVSGEDLEGWWVDTLLVDHDEVFVGAVAELLLKFDDLQHSVVSELALRLDQLFSLFGVGPEESRVDLSLFVLERHVEAHDVAIFKSGGHVGLAATVVEDQALDKF